MTTTTNPDPPSITCPQCGAVSYNAHDIAHRYCGRCHQFHEFFEDTDVRTLYQAMTTHALESLRAAFVLDRRHSRPPDRLSTFCDGRLALIDAVLRERTS